VRFGSILITGGAGFVGANLSLYLKGRFPDVRVTALDNLSRRGSELNIPRLRDSEVDFLHGDVRCPEDLTRCLDFDLLIDCSAEPSVQAGANSSPRFVLNANLLGTINCLEETRERNAAFLFLSTSRVYPIARLNGLPFVENESRFEWQIEHGTRGVSAAGVSEDFPLEGARSFYGASKLSGELLVAEYVHNYGMNCLINRCGVLAGPWQMGQVDQGVITLWVARHQFNRPLSYRGFDGHGKQVRDVLHVLDLCELISQQLETDTGWNGSVFNVGGGSDVSTSLCELTGICEGVTSTRLDIGAVPETSDLDLRIYLTDSSRVRQTYGWKPQRSVQNIVEDIHGWILSNQSQLKTILA
jgi:CDP-paratose 2-epimerase